MSKSVRFLLVVVLILTACGGRSDQKSSPASPTSAADFNAQAPGQSPTSPAEPVGEANQPDLFQLRNLDMHPYRSRIEGLDSYRLRAHWVVVAKPGSGLSSSFFGIEFAYAQSPRAEEIALFSGPPEGPSQIARAVLRDGSVWYDEGRGPKQVSSEVGMPFADRLDLLATAVSGLVGDARLVGFETVDGVDAKHYAFDLSAARDGLYTGLQGDIWLASPGGYVLKYGFGAEDERANYQWYWQVYDIDEAFAINPPS